MDVYKEGETAKGISTRVTASSLRHHMHYNTLNNETSSTAIMQHIRLIGLTLHRKSLTKTGFFRTIISGMFCLT